MKKVLAFGYGIACYLMFLGVFVYFIGFVGDILVSKSVAAGATSGFWEALAVDAGLLSLFAVQHSVMARHGFKRAWTKIVPPHLERSTYVLAASLVLAGVMWAWRPIPTTLWSAESSTVATVLHGVFWAGWGTVFLATFLIDHFRLFGVKQVWAHLQGKELRPPEFQTPALYKLVRHPLYLGFLLAFWAGPTMTGGRLLLAGVWTGWILLAIRLEERDLTSFHGADYLEYRNRVPMLLPLAKTGGSSARPESRKERKLSGSGA